MAARSGGETVRRHMVRGDAGLFAEATHVAEQLSRRMDTSDWSGIDPYDGLSSPVAGALRRPVARQVLLQAVRRSPVNLRPLLRIAPRRMAATTGLAASATARLATEPFWSDQLTRLGRWTAQSRLADGPYQGLWGYEFDVQTRWGFYPAGSPNLVATSFAAHGCLDAQTLPPAELERLGHGLLRHHWRGRFFGYTPYSTALIHNANLLGAALAARLSAIDRLDGGLRGDLQNAAIIGTSTTLSHQRVDGSWPYGEGGRLGWIDGFHTAYNLLSLDRLSQHGSGDTEHALERGARYYFAHLFADGIPLYYPDRPSGPTDVNNVATGLRAAIWGSQRGHLPEDRPVRVFEYLLAAFWDPSGYFRSTAGRAMPAGRLNFPRWGAAPALDALSSLIVWDHERNSP